MRFCRVKSSINGVLLLVAAILLLTGGGCGSGERGKADGRSAEKSAAPEVGSAAESGNNATGRRQPRRTLTFGNAKTENSKQAAGGGSGGAGSGSGGADPEPAGDIASKRERSFIAARGPAVFPRDSVIGLLENYTVALPETRRLDAQQVQAAARRFFTILREGERLEPLLHPDVASGLAERLHQEAVPAEITGVRYGTAAIEGQEARVNVRLFGTPGRAAGELVFSFMEGIWRVEAVDIDFSALREPYEPPKQEGIGGQNVSPLYF